MQEDIRLKIGADTSQAKKEVKKLEEETNNLGKKVSEIKLKNGSFSKEEIIQLKKEIELTALKAKTIYFTEGNKSAEELSNRLKEMHKSLGNTKKQIEETQAIFSKMDFIIGNIASSLIQTVGGDIKNLVNQGAELSKQLEYADKKIQSISNLSSVDINANVEKIGLETGTDFGELKEGLYQIISAVGDIPEAYNLLETSNKLAITGFTNLGNAVDGLTTVLNAYKMQMNEADRVANIFVKTQKYGKITVDEFARDLAQSVPYATQLGISIEEIGTSIALLTSRGVKPAQAETQLASFLRNMLDDTNELTKELSKNLGMSVREYIKNDGDLIKLIGEIEKVEKKAGKAITSFSLDSEAKAFILQLKDGEEAYKRFYSSISSTNDEINTNMNKMLNTQKSATERAQRYWEIFSMKIGNIKSNIIAEVGDIITGFDKTDSQMKELNSFIKSNINILDEFAGVQNLSKNEQERLNKAMENLSSIAPNIVNAFRSMKQGIIDYTEYAKLANKETEALTKSNLTIELFNAKEKEKKIRKDFDERSEIFKLATHIYSKKFGTSNPEVILSKLNENYLKSGNKNDFDLFKAYSDNMQQYNLELERLKKARKVITDLDKEIKSIGKLEEEKKESTDKSKDDNTPLKQNTTSSEEDLKTQYDRTYKKEELRIETEYNNKIIEATKQYNEKMAQLKGIGTEKEIESIKRAYQNKIDEALKNKEISNLKNKISNTYYDTDGYDKDNKTKVDNELYYNSQISALEIEYSMKKSNDELRESQENLKEAITNMSTNLKNLGNLFQTIGENTGSTSIKNIANGLGLGSTIFDYLKQSDKGNNFLKGLLGISDINLNKISTSLGDFSMGAGIGGAISGMLGGGAEGNIGGSIGSAIGTAVGGPVGSVVGGALGSAVGSVFGSKSKKKKKREEEKRKAALERLKKGQISGQYKWQDVVEAFNEDLERAGMGEYITLFDKVSANTNYDDILSTLNSAKRGDDGVSMTALKQLMPQYTESEIMDWFKAITGGAVLNGDTLSTGEGKYGAIDLSALAQQITNTNRELEQSLKETIKNIIDFTAGELANVVKEGFFDGIDDIGDNIEQMIANSLKNAFINTELAKGLFNGLSDKVQDYITEMFKSDSNLGIDLGTDNLEDLTFQQYIDLIKKYMELSSDKMEDIFGELGLNIDNLTDSVDKLNENMSKNVVSGIATNLWKQNLGIKEPVKVDTNLTIDMPVMLSGKEMDRYIIKVVNDSIKRSRRSGNGIGRG